MATGSQESDQRRYLDQEYVNMPLDVLLAELERDLSTIAVRRRGDKAREIVKRWETDHPDEALPEEVQWEVQVLDMMAVRRGQRSGESIGRFRPSIEWKNGAVYPDVDGLMSDDHAAEYFRKRAAGTTNLVQKARYADFLWEALRSQQAPDAFKFGVMAARAYTEVADLCLKEGEYIEMADALERAAELALQLNNRDIGQQVVISVVDALNQLPSEHKDRWVLDLGSVLVWYADSKFADLVPTSTLEQVRSVCLDGIAYHDAQDQRNLFILHDLMMLCSALSRRLGDGEASWTWQVAIAQSWEKEARQRETGEGPTGGSLAAFKFAENALRLYQQLASWAPHDEGRQRIEARTEELKGEVLRLTRQAESEMKEIKISADIPRKVLDEMIAPLFEVEPERVFQLLSVAPFLLPDLDKLRQEAIEAAEKYVFSSLLGRVSLRDGRKVDEIAAFEGESIQFRQQLDMWFQTHWQLLDFVFYRLKEADLFTVERFIEHVTRWQLVDERDIPFIEVALERYFAEDYISAVHILAPRVERMLKGAFEQSGLPPVVVPNVRQIREQTLGNFLRREEVKQALGESVWTYLNYALVDETGLNLRNDVAHGWIDASNCNRITAQILIFVVILLTRLGIEDSSDEPVPSND